MPKYSIATMFKGVDKEWIKVLTSKKIMPLLSGALTKLGKLDNIDDITPHPNDILNFARTTPYNKVKIVILGQDPYPKKGDAHGLAFSSMSSKVPSSLRNIYKCLKKQNLVDDIPSNSDLTFWAKQGVLLLNASLTTSVGKTNAHAKIWKPFTDELIKYISHDSKCGPVDSLIFMLWGKYAKEKMKIINEDCIIYTWIHPSPLAQSSAKISDRFVNCDHFTEANIALKDIMGLKPINWDPCQHTTVYTDGACSNNGNGIFSSAGYAAYFSKGPLDSTVVYGKVPPAVIDGKMVYGTNNRGEGLGIITALEYILENNIKANTTLVTDSEFWKKMIEQYMPSWEDRGVDFKDKKNYDLTTRLHDAVKRVKKLGKFTIIHVASHGKNPNAPPDQVKGNSIADEYACKGKGLKNYDTVINKL